MFSVILAEGSTQFDEDYDILNESTPQTAKWVNNEEIKLFRKYLRFKTVSPDSDLGNIRF